MTFFPIIFLYLLSSGCTYTQTQAANNSGLVVAIIILLPPSSSNSISLKVESNSLSSKSACAIAVWHCTHHIDGAVCLYTNPFLCRSKNDFCDVLMQCASIVEYTCEKSQLIPIIFQSFTKSGFISCNVFWHNVTNSCLCIFVDFTFFNFSINLSVGNPLSSVPNG